ncbi:MAG: RdgB/HAM1 family non-canonical purine NTP pyrophosphatase [Pseudomonadota bacterium]
MSRSPNGTAMVIASDNVGKLNEFDQLFKPLGYTVHRQSDFNIVQPPETGRTFIENALVKARVAAAGAARPALGDDSGLVVKSLGGRPGIRSARYAGEQASADDNIDRLLAELHGCADDQRGAFFFCCLVYLRSADDPAPVIATGRWPGRILKARAGRGGFGYDPVFYDPELQASAAQLAPETKNRVSHRGRALQHLIDQLRER